MGDEKPTESSQNVDKKPEASTSPENSDKKPEASASSENSGEKPEVTLEPVVIDLAREADQDRVRVFTKKQPKKTIEKQPENTVEKKDKSET